MLTPRCCIIALMTGCLLSSSLPLNAADVAPSAAVQAAVEPFVASHSLAGAVALTADKDKILSITTVGARDIAGGKAMPPDAVFWIASQSKTMTAAAVMILVDEGKISLDDPAEKYLPELKNLWVAVESDGEHVLLKRPKTKPTIRHLLSHTSGMPFKSELETPTLDGLPLAVAVRSYAVTPLIYQPGEGYQYSNAGINTAARIIEVVTGKSYESFMDERLFEPLGMTDTTFWPTDKQVERLAKSYKPNAEKNDLVETTISQLQYPLDQRAGRYPMPAGGLFSTATDCARFCQMLLNEGTLDGKKILSPEAVAEMSKRQTPTSVKESYGLGCSVGGDSFGHGGAMATNMNIDRKRGLVTVWLVQHAGFPGDGNKAQGAFRSAAEK